ncbi:hypothetical protein C8R46DRAFT_1361911 [Mycena filopes]|nr:hypothetical protein C8R46DRAFT_1361911 [Mycena filopes]
MATQSVGQRRARSSSASSNDRPTRRRRVEGSWEPEGAVVSIRDPAFYKEDGDCVLKVDTYLFKVHRYHLLRSAGSVFKDMFTFPSGAAEAQGQSDSNPIILSGDTPDRFRAFLKIAYMELLEFQEAETQLDQLPTFIDCAHFSHKYEITPLLRAAVKAALNLLESYPVLTIELGISALDLSGLCDDIQLSPGTFNCKCRLRCAVHLSWLRHFPIFPTFEFLAQIMDIGVQYELDDLAAWAAADYHYKMANLPELTADGGTTPPPFTGHTWLKTEHRMRILAGAWSMEQSWRLIIATTPAFPPDHVCAQAIHARTCVPAWNTIWKRIVASPELPAYSSTRFDWQGRSSALTKLLTEAFNGAVVGCVATAKVVD